ncbi:MAG: hypothetical protein GY950_23450 [bacterium]|nr:hypothetical protein [bacterium]
MQPLRAENVQKCLDLLEDFQEAVPEEDFNETLKEKKAQAQYALGHLHTLFKEEYPGGGGNPPECGQEESG